MNYPFYLKTGVGNACAGHKRSMVCPDSFRNIVPSPIFSLGATEPTGSIFKKKKNITINT
jgi:hypothetical protein